MPKIRPHSLVYLLIILCLLAIVIGALAGIDTAVAPTDTPTEPPSPTATPSPSPVATQSAEGVIPTSVPNTPTTTAGPSSKTDAALIWIKACGESFFKFLARVGKIIQALWPFLAGLLILLLIWRLIPRFIDEAQSYRLEFDPLQNGTGEESLKEEMMGIEALLREKLIYEVKILQQNIEEYSGRTSEGATFPSKFSLPLNTGTTETLDKVVDAWGEETPKYAKPLLSLWRYLSPGRGVRIRMTLQSSGNAADPVGITYEFIDLSTQKNSKVFTVWEEEGIKTELRPWISCQETDPEDEPDEENEPGEEALQAAPVAPNDLPAWSLGVAKALEDASLYEEALPYYEQAFAEKKASPEIVTALVRCHNELARRAGPAAAFATASKLEENELLEAAIESYAGIFPDKTERDTARQRWRIALGLEPGSKGKALDQLAGAYLNPLDLHDEAVSLYKRAVQEGNTESVKTLRDLQTTQAAALVRASQLLFQNAQWIAADTYLTKAVANVPDYEPAIQLQTRLKAKKPVEENKEALAAFEVGQVYSKQGNQASATEYFVKALEKQPDYQEAREALTTSLQETNSLRSRFEHLLDGALVWLAVELFRLETDRLTGDAEKDKCRKAQYHNFYGAHFLSYFESMPSSALWAEDEFRNAIEACWGWLQPYEGLGDLYYLQGLNQAKEKTARQMLGQAIAWYDLALDKKILSRDGDLKDISEPVKLRINVDRCLAEMLNCPGKPSTAWELLGWLETKLRHEMSKKKVESKPGKGTSKLEETAALRDFEETYFSLAVCHALAAYREKKSTGSSGHPQPDQAKPWACFYLTCAAMLEPNRMYEAQLHPILAEIVGETERAELVRQIEFRRYKQNARPKGDEFNWQDVREVLEHVKLAIPKDLEEK